MLRLLSTLAFALAVVACNSSDPFSPAPLSSTVQLSPSGTIVADGVTQVQILVTVRNERGEPLEGQQVAVAVSGSGNVLVQPSAPTDVNGEAVATLASTVAETKTITVTINPGPDQIVLTARPTVQFVGNPATISATLSSIAAVPSSGVVANGIEQAAITVVVRDANGNGVPGQTVQIAASGTGNTVMQPAGATDASGTASASLASTVAETKTLTATVNPGPSQVVLADQPAVQFVGNPAAISPTLSTIAAAPDFGARANGADLVTITVVVRDTGGNPVAGRVVQLSASGQGNTLAQPGSPTDASGTASGTLRTTAAEPKTISAVVDPGPGQVALSTMATAVFVWSGSRRSFVRQSGSDASSGASPATAWGSIGMAASSAGPGDTVYVGAGTYLESVVLTTDGTAAEPITFLADETGEFTSDAGEVVVDGQGAAAVFQIDGADHVILEGFTITGASPASGNGIWIGDAATTGVRVRRNRIYANGRGVLARNADDLVLERNRISRQASSTGSADGILIDGGNGVDLRGNLIYANEGRGVFVTGGALNLLAEANSLYANEDDQLRVDGLLNLATAQHNVVTEGLAEGLQLDLLSTLLSQFNDSWGNLGLNWLGLSLGLGDLSADPLLVDPDGPDNLLGGANGADDRFELDALAPSPAADAGSTSAAGILFSDGSSLADGTTRTDGVLDGTPPDGALANLGFHYDAPVGDLAPLADGEARAVYGAASERQARLRTFDPSTDSWSSPVLAPPAGASLRWLVHALSPLDDGEEVTLAFHEDGTSTGLEALRWSGVAWHEDWSSSGIAVGDACARGFDLAYESSGDLLAVVSDGSANPRYRTRSQGEWSADAPVFAIPPGSTKVLWVALASRPGTDEISLVFADADFDLHAIVWNGSAWDAASVATLETALRTVDTRSFDIESEGSSGDALVLWAGPADAAAFATRAAGTNTWSVQSGIAGLGPTPATFDLAADPSSDRIAMIGLGDAAAGSEPKAAMWTGLAWSDVVFIETAPAISLGAQTGDVNVAAGWVGSSGVAVAVYGDDTAGAIDWARWSSVGGWILQSDIVVASKGTTESVRIKRSPTASELLAVLSDSNGDLYAASYDGTVWTLTNGGAALETDLSSLAGVSFDLRFRSP